jgi:hypothetical protein
MRSGRRPGLLAGRLRLLVRIAAIGLWRILRLALIRRLSRGRAGAQIRRKVRLPWLAIGLRRRIRELGFLPSGYGLRLLVPL